MDPLEGFLRFGIWCFVLVDLICWVEGLGVDKEVEVDDMMVEAVDK
ncbi:hypothetical protein QFZ87_000595 [Bacillus sp. SLBN-46]|nr:hypothetical protein [Bacillus sp. SLBN-46]